MILKKLSFVVKLFIFLSLILLSVSVTAGDSVQKPEIDIHNLRFDHVLNLGMKARPATVQDNDGYMWFGGQGEGLFRYDGYELKKYGVGPGLMANGTVNRLRIDRENPDIFWIATSGGFHHFDKSSETFTVYLHNPDDPASLGNNGTYDVLQDGRDHNIFWIGTGNGLNKFDAAGKTFTRYEPDPDDPDTVNFTEVWRFIEDRRDPNVLWIATYGGGLDRFEKDRETFTHFVNDPEDENTVAGNVIKHVLQDKENPDILWLVIGKGKGLDKFNTRTGKFTHFRHNPDDPDSIQTDVLSICYDDGYGRLWLGGWSRPSGLILFDKKQETFRQYLHAPEDPMSIASDMVNQIYEDRAGIFWVIMASGHIDKIDPYAQNFALYRSQTENSASLINNSITALYQDREGLVWIGTAKGMTTYNPSRDRFARLKHHPDDPTALPEGGILGIFQDSAGMMWISFHNGPLVQFDKDTDQVINRYLPQPPADSFTKMVEDTQNPNILWLGTRVGGFARFDKKSERFTYYPPDPKAPEKGPALKPYYYEVLADPDDSGLIWMSSGYLTTNGLIRFDTRTERFTHYLPDANDPTAISSDATRMIHIDRSGRLWVGTEGGGLNQFDKKTERFTHYVTEQGVPLNVNAILEDDQGRLWLGTNEGLCCFHPETGEVERQYRETDGLQADMFAPLAALRTDDGCLWFGGGNGLSRFHPDKLVTNTTPPPVVLTRLTQGGEVKDWGEQKVPNRLGSITLDWKENFFEFEYAALNFSIPEKNQYQYKLEGFDNEWYHAGTRRFGRYSGLQEGMYVLKIRGSNNDGVWTDKPATLNVSVKPHIAEGTQVFSLEDIRRGTSADLRFNENNLLFEAAPLEYSILEKKNYCYMLEGYDNGWRCIRNSRYIPYKNVSEGSYTFRIKDSESNTHYTMDITIHPPFYRSWWFMGMIGAGIILLAGAFYQQRIRYLKREQTVRQEKALLLKEMEIARQIQTLLLPEKPELSGYDIAASCDPAEEVGGDYYDVISVEGYKWIVVGDVSGHGLTSGLVMMMVETAIHTVLLENPDVEPSRLLAAINKTIYLNIQKMNEAKHMTIVVLATGKNGDFFFSGLHEDILIWRKQSDTLEKVRTDGMWIGMEPDISEMLSVSSLNMASGDCMVLYTDGITEAREPGDGAFFGEERLEAVVKRSGNKSVSEIHRDIMNALKPYEKTDDVTLFVMKRV